MSVQAANPIHMVRFRPNVAALVINTKGKLLVCERFGEPGAWQFPQGGVDPGEDMAEALKREVREEIGLQPKHYKIIEVRDGYRYLYPKGIRSKKLKKHGNHGQEQTYFLCKLKSNAPKVDVHQWPAEFQDYRWIKPENFKLKWLPDFKKDVYREVLRDFFGVEL
jgi:putative (di)nucleoside polyphosphate hydrolase